MEPPFLLTYTPPLAPLPIWLSYSSTPILTATATYSYAVAGSPTPLAATIVQTRYSVAVIQLALTVDAPEGIELGFPYVRAGVSTGARIGSVLGGGLITLAPVSTSIPLVTATPTMQSVIASSVPSGSPSPALVVSSIVLSTSSVANSVSGTPTTATVVSSTLSSAQSTTTSSPSSTTLASSSSSLTASAQVSTSASTPISTAVSTSANRSPVRSTLAIVLGSVFGILLLLIILFFLERRRRHRNRLAGADWRSSSNSSGREQGRQSRFWRFAGLGVIGRRRGSKDGLLAGEKRGSRDIEEKNPFSDPTFVDADRDIFTTPPRRFARPAHQSGRSVDETATLLDEGWSSPDVLAGEDLGGNRAPNDPLHQARVRSQYEDAVGATGMLARIATAASSPYLNSATNSPGSAVNGRESRTDLPRRTTSMRSGIAEREEGVEGDLSSPDSRYRTFASPVISEMGWMSGSKNRLRDVEYGSVEVVDDEEGLTDSPSSSGGRSGESDGSHAGHERVRQSRDGLAALQDSPLPIFAAPRWQGAGTRQPVRGSPTDSDLNLDPPILLATPSPPSHSSSATLGDSAASNLLVKLSSGIGGMLTGLGLGNVGSTTDSKGTPMEDEEKRLMDQGYQSPLGKSAAPLRLSPSRQNDLLPPSPPRPNSSLRGRSSPNEFGREGIEDGRRLAERKERGMTNSSFGTLGQRISKAANSNSIYARSMGSSSSADHSQSSSESPIHFPDAHSLRTHSTPFHNKSTSDPNSDHSSLPRRMRYPARSGHLADSSGSTSGSHRANTLGRGARREGESSSGADPRAFGSASASEGSHHPSFEGSRSEGVMARKE